ncbi:aspartyl-phosphate phosphatase Spo0E family protein [Metabacillus fastidiosus]|uniref:aspartyl-phosphate phosphatase Spo0E family protein n=1 Tax=Metabacillus fastidiosus TaxID=1458 RepID=UPI003D289396
MKQELLRAELLMSINNKREEMIKTAEKESFTSEAVLKVSQDLDELLNIYQRLSIQENESNHPIQDFYIANKKSLTPRDACSANS